MLFFLILPPFTCTSRQETSRDWKKWPEKEKRHLLLVKPDLSQTPIHMPRLMPGCHPSTRSREVAFGIRKKGPGEGVQGGHPKENAQLGCSHAKGDDLPPQSCSVWAEVSTRGSCGLSQPESPVGIAGTSICLLHVQCLHATLWSNCPAPLILVLQ